MRGSSNRRDANAAACWLLPLALFICCVISMTCAEGLGRRGADSVRLLDVKALTLRSGAKTAGRRVASIPQLQCVGGSAGCSWTPETVLCENRGADDSGVVQWACQADMPSELRFGKIEVLCEGYSSPDDEFILRGSCGLEYTLEGEGRGGYYNDGGSYRGGGRQLLHHHSNSQGGGLGTLLVWGMIALFAYWWFIGSRGPAGGGDGGPGGGTGRGPWGGGGGGGGGGGDNWRGGGGGGGGGPSCSEPPPPSTGQQQGSPFGGFWTGAAAGGVLGYLMGGGRQRRGWGFNTYAPQGYTGPSWTGGGGFRMGGGGGGGGGGTRTATGFGGTRTR